MEAGEEPEKEGKQQYFNFKRFKADDAFKVKDTTAQGNIYAAREVEGFEQSEYVKFNKTEEEI